LTQTSGSVFPSRLVTCTEMLKREAAAGCLA
jgi:hypothetical protein